MFNVALGKSEDDETIYGYSWVTNSGIIIEEIIIQNDVKEGIMCRFLQVIEPLVSQ